MTPTGPGPGAGLDPGPGLEPEAELRAGLELRPGVEPAADRRDSLMEAWCISSMTRGHAGHFCTIADLLRLRPTKRSAAATSRRLTRT
jgi:hypothetical protein